MDMVVQTSLEVGLHSACQVCDQRLRVRQDRTPSPSTRTQFPCRPAFGPCSLGPEPGTNDLARERGNVMHGANYVTAEFAATHSKLGRSWGCPALDPAVHREAIDTIRGGTIAARGTARVCGDLGVVRAAGLASRGRGPCTWMGRTRTADGLGTVHANA